LSNRTITLDSNGIKLSGELYLPGDDKSLPYPTVVICHGIPSGVMDPDDPGYPALALEISHRGFAVAIFNFRGCGLSGGNFDLGGWKQDLNVVIDYLWALEETDRSHLFVLGFSGGAAISVCQAAQDKRLAAVAACACPAKFQRLSDAAISGETIEYFRRVGIIRDKDFPSDIGKWLEGFKQVNPLECIARISPRSVLLVHGSQDDLVRIADAKKLFQRALEPKQLRIIKGAGHQLRLDEQLMAEVIGWFESLSGSLTQV